MLLLGYALEHFDSVHLDATVFFRRQRHQLAIRALVLFLLDLHLLLLLLKSCTLYEMVLSLVGLRLHTFTGERV